MRKLLLAATCALLLGGAFESFAALPAIPGAVGAPVVAMRAGAAGDNDGITVDNLIFADNEHPANITSVRSLYQEILNRGMTVGNGHETVKFYLKDPALQGVDQNGNDIDQNSADIRKRNISEMLKLALTKKTVALPGIATPINLQNLTARIQNIGAIHAITTALSAAGDELARVFLRKAQANIGKIETAVDQINAAATNVRNALAEANGDAQNWSHNIATVCRTYGLFVATYHANMNIIQPLRDAKTDVRAVEYDGGYASYRAARSIINLADTVGSLKDEVAKTFYHITNTVKLKNADFVFIVLTLASISKGKDGQVDSDGLLLQNDMLGVLANASDGPNEVKDTTTMVKNFNSGIFQIARPVELPPEVSATDIATAMAAAVATAGVAGPAAPEAAIAAALDPAAIAAAAAPGIAAAAAAPNPETAAELARENAAKAAITAAITAAMDPAAAAAANLIATAAAAAAAVLGASEAVKAAAEITAQPAQLALFRDVNENHWRLKFVNRNRIPALTAANYGNYQLQQR